METEQEKTDILTASTPFDEKAAIARIRNGDKEAFSEIVNQYQNRLYNTIYRMVNSENDALDICQDVFLKSFRNIAFFKGESSFLTYLYRIAFNQSIIYRSRRKKMAAVDFKCNPHCLAEKELAGNNPDHAENIQNEECNEQIQGALNSLEPELKEIVVLKDMECLSYDEISRTLDISVSQVRTSLAKARDILRKKLKDLL